MSAKQLFSNVLSVASRQSAVEFYFHALPALLLLSAEVLSIREARALAPDAQSLATIYLAMLQ
jgi:hypothetical protein